MRYWDSTDYVLALLIAAIVGIFGLLIVTSVVDARWDAACKAAGFREMQVTWPYEPYCITRSEQTDLVKPLREVRRDR